MVTVRKAETEQELADARELAVEYLQWAVGRLSQAYGLAWDVDALIESTLTELFTQPDLQILVAYEGRQPVGTACLHPIGPDTGEIKRMFVRPAHRRQGVGRQLMERLLEEAKALGYRTIRLDSVRFMDAAHRLYQSFGFRETGEYPESEIPPEIRRHWRFFERDLS
jgi:GNAT superfamily N-acetyltransferase